MKHMPRKILIIVLIVAFAFCITGCGGKKGALLDEKVSGMIDCLVAQDGDGAYAYIYPEDTLKDSFLSTVEDIYEYFPVTPGYTVEREGYSYKKSLNSGSDIIEGQYKVEFDGNVFYIIASWRSDDKGSGFTTFYAFNEEDWAKAKEGAKN